MDTWTTLNPEYDWLLLDDEDCLEFVHQFASDEEQLAFARVATGAQRADLLRYLFLRSLGGMYVDTDVEAIKPLREVLLPNLTHLSCATMEPDFIAYAPSHPFLDAVVRYTVRSVNDQTELLATGNETRCHGSHQCVIRVTGPLAYQNSVIAASSKELGCANPPTLLPDLVVGQCDGSGEPLVRASRTCVADPSDPYSYCGVAKHWDCRNSAAKRDCGARHYSRASVFFNVSAKRGLLSNSL